MLPFVLQEGYFCGSYNSSATDTVTVDFLNTVYQRYIASADVSGCCYYSAYY